jgi:hypothetical protein
MFNEANSVDTFIRDVLAGAQAAAKRPGVGASRAGHLWTARKTLRRGASARRMDTTNWS